MTEGLTEWIKEREEEIVAFLARIVAVDSVTGREGEMARVCGEWLEAQGLDVTLQPAKDRLNALGSVGEGKRTLIFSGHLDTVPPNAGDWRFGPWNAKVTEGKVWGLGASDLKGSIAATYFAQLYVKERFGGEANGRIVSAYTIEEETTGDGTQLFLDWAEESGYLDFAQTWCVVTEPTGLKQVCLGNRASSFVTVRVTGLGGHGSRPHLARNPIPKLTSVLDRVRELQEVWAEPYGDPDFGRPTMTPTSLTAGDKEGTNVIPEFAEAVIDCRPTPGLWRDDLREFRRGLGELFDDCREEGFEITWSEQYAREGHKLDRDHPLAAMTREVLHDELGWNDVEESYTPAGNDAVFFAMKGIPTINKVGPGHPELAHRVDEHVAIENVLKGTELYARLACRFLRGE